ncbi:alcohol dehydrogenase family protein [Ilumatobacter coccineus]|uniref:Putative oxidoreductase n=1 Tax=Ilumatobacter coccineus (strain NBRC 103263 / KCTC 29153 / YM16-304) TaxID=1313172 RepID=A0A6C7DZN3_ILUCY|nr:alcohol dehydrogenase family protein [Ilumatobacter coccineus]BAN00617.1 putative oxidoreductase [Ilumatobacter coccineus YM16-304]
MIIPTTMTAVLLTGHGGTEMLEYRTDVPTPTVGPGDVLVRVGAAGVNNTDINTRIGWYSKSVTGATNAGAGGLDDVDRTDATWSGTPLEFPRIQGADVCGEIVAVGAEVDPDRIGERVLGRAMMRHPQPDPANPFACWTLGSEADGGFAQFTAMPAYGAVAVRSDWTDVELASMPCASSTAENMLQRASVGAERVLVTGASGGVGSAAIQLATRRGATVTAVCGASKADQVAALGAHRVVDRDDDLLGALERNSFDVVVDLVAGDDWPAFMELLRPGGRYVTSGAIAGPICEIDIRTLYLKDLTLFGATFQPDEVFADLVGYIERNEIRPLVAATYPLADIARAQDDFVAKRHVGKLVLVPPR